MNRLLNLLFPYPCLSCGSDATIKAPKEFRSEIYLLCDLCSPKESDLHSSLLLREQFLSSIKSIYSNPSPPRTELCMCCGERIHQSSSCPLCLIGAISPLRELRSVWRYQGLTELIVKQYKFHHALYLTEFITSTLKIALSSFRNKGWDMMLPVPSSNSNLRERGYYHTGIITNKLSKKTNIPTNLYTLNSARDRTSQISHNTEQRIQNVANSFSCVAERVLNKKILLIDDTITSGATLKAAATTLLNAGALAVDALTLTRSQSFETYQLDLLMKQAA
jgi:ComF family protein